MDARSRDVEVAPLPSQVKAARRRLMLRDSLTFLTLTLVALAMSGVTTLLFRSFEAHREELAVRWAERGREALAAGKPAEAVTAMRTSLGFRPDVRENQLALARALAASGRVDEAENYFVNLWQSQPGDGGINLELARLARQQGRTFNAIEYYRAAIFGNWSGDGPARRRNIRLELSSYLVELGQGKAARAELLIAAGNNPDAASQLRIGEALEAADAAKDAATAYRNASEDKTFAATAQAKLGELCYAQGDYACAEEELTQALHHSSWTDAQKERMSTLQQNAVRLQTLAASPSVPSALRVEHLLRDGHFAAQRMNVCLAENADATAAFGDIPSRWKTLDTPKNRALLRTDDDLQRQYLELIFEMEKAAEGPCGTASGDHALMLHLSAHPLTRWAEQP